jgi:glutamyl/glutaminyl-tRNA synthetase
VVEGRDLAWITSLVAGLQERAQLYGDFAEKASFLVEPLEWDEAALKVLTGDEAPAVLAAIQQALQAEADFPPADFPGLAKAVAAEMEIGMGKVMKPVRVALTGALGGPDLGQVFSWLGRDMAFKRLQDAAKLVATS